MRLLVEQETQVGEFHGVPAHCGGDGFVPLLAYGAFSVFEPGNGYVFGLFPAVC